MILLVLTVISILLVFAWLINRWILRNSINLAYQIPSNKWHKFLGFGVILKLEGILEYLNDYATKYGPNSVLWSGPIALYLTSDPEAIKDILMSKNCVDKPDLVMNGITHTAGLGVITTNGPVWSHHRKIMSKTFSNKNLLSFLPIFNEEINSLITEIDKSLERGNNLNILQTFQKLTLKISSKTILKRNLEETKFDPLTLVDYLNKILDCCVAGCVQVYWKIGFLRELVKIFKLRDVTKGVTMYKNLILESWNILKNNNTNNSSYLPERNSTLDYVLKGVQENLIQEHEIPNEMIHLFLAAFETSSTTSYFVLMLLAMHPKYQELVYNEIQSILPADSNDLSLEIVDQLTYLEMVINETMRVIPTVPMIIRNVSNENVTLSSGVTLAVGQRIAIDIFSLHRSKKIWGPNAETFNPDNFLPSNIATRHPFSFIPFAKGQRFCIGWRYGMLVSKISLAKLIKTYKFSTDFKFEDLKFRNHLSMKLVDEPQLYLERREIIK